MKKLLTTICLMVTPVFASAGTAFEDDPTNYFVSGSGANEALEMVNEIICFFKNSFYTVKSIIKFRSHSNYL